MVMVKDTVQMGQVPEFIYNIPHEYTRAILNEIAGETIYVEYDMFGEYYIVNADTGLHFRIDCVYPKSEEDRKPKDPKYPYYIFTSDMVLPKLTETDARFNDDVVQCESISLPSLRIAHDDFLSQPYQRLKSVNCPELTEAGDNFLAKSPIGVPKIEFQKLASVGRNSFGGIAYCDELKLPNLQVIKSGSFCHDPKAGNIRLKKIELPSAKELNHDSFNNLGGVEEISLPVAKGVSNNSFNNLTHLKKVDLPVAEYIFDRSFMGCQKVETINLPLAKEIHDFCFHDCRALTQVNVPRVVYLCDYVFSLVPALESISLPSCRYIYKNVLSHAVNLKHLLVPVAEQIGEDFLEYNEELTEARFPLVTFVEGGWFVDNKKLRVFEAPNAKGYSFKEHGRDVHPLVRRVMDEMREKKRGQ